MKDKLVMPSYMRFKKQYYTIFNATTLRRIQDLFGVILFLEREKRFSILWWFELCAIITEGLLCLPSVQVWFFLQRVE